MVGLHRNLKMVRWFSIMALEYNCHIISLVFFNTLWCQVMFVTLWCWAMLSQKGIFVHQNMTSSFGHCIVRKHFIHHTKISSYVCHIMTWGYAHHITTLTYVNNTMMSGYVFHNDITLCSSLDNEFLDMFTTFWCSILYVILWYQGMFITLWCWGMFVIMK